MNINPANLLLLLGLGILTSACNYTPNHQKTALQQIPNSGYIASQGAELFYQSIGSGIPILVLHGGPGMDHTYFLPHLKAYPDNYQFIFFDQRACGKSSWEIDSTSMNMAAFVQDIEAVREYFNLEKVNLLGHSWGGLLAMWYANQHPDNLASLVLLSTIPANKAYEVEAAKINQEHFKEEDLLAMQELMVSEDMKNREKATIEKVYKLNFSGSFYQRYYLDSLQLNLPENFGERQGKLRHLMGDLSAYDLYDSLTKIKAPTLIIQGDYDATPLEAIQRIDDKIPNAKLTVLKNTGHFPFIESKSDFWKSLNEFYKK